MGRLPARRRGGRQPWRRLAGARRPGQQRLAASAIALYEAFFNERPPGWPATGTAALMVLTAQRRTSSRLPRTSEKPARTCLLDHAAELQQAIAYVASAHVLVDVAPAALERAAEAWGPVTPDA